MKSIDWRFRPPYKSFIKNELYANYHDGFDDNLMDHVIGLMDDNEIAIGVCPFRKNMDNADCISLAEEYPDRFRALIHVDPWDGPQGLEEIDRYVLNGPAAGIIIEPGQHFIREKMYADDKMLYPIYEKCEKDNILLTITYGGMFNNDPDYYMPSPIAHVCNDFPKLKIVLAHGAWPWVTSICHVAYNHEFLYISPDAYMRFNQPGHQDYATAANYWLTNKIIFGTAYSYPSDEFVSGAIEDYISQLKPEARENVLYNNAAGLLGLQEMTPFTPMPQ